MPAMAIGGAIVYGLMSTVFKKEGPPQELQEKGKETEQRSKVQAPLTEEVRAVCGH